MEALVLAAGFGTRFRPRTLETPKPLLPFLGREILFRLFDHLIGEGIDRFVVNSHHLADQLEASVGESYRGFPVGFSREEEILGTSGAIRRACEAGLLRGEEFFVVNGDLFTTLPLAPPGRASPRGSLGARGASERLARRGDAALGYARGRLAVVGRNPVATLEGPWLFTGIQFARRALVDRIPQGRSELAADLLRPSAVAGDGAFVLVPFRAPEEGLWFDLGSPERLARAEERARAAGVA